MRVKRFGARIAADPGGHAVIAVPFDPDGAWGAKAQHHVNGTVNGCRVRVTSSRHPPDPLTAGPFPQRSPPRLLTGAACGGLGSPPARRTRRTFLHHWHSTVHAGDLLHRLTPLSGHTAERRISRGFCHATGGCWPYPRTLTATAAISAGASRRGVPAAEARRYTSHSHSRYTLLSCAAARSGPTVTAPWLPIRQAVRSRSARTTLRASPSVPY